MHGMHARTPKNFVLEERLERYADVIELVPRAYRGRWAEACHPIGTTGPGRYESVHLDLGCGKGAYLVERAHHSPRMLFVGVDEEPLCIAYTAQAISEQQLPNAVVVPARGDGICAVFGPGELASLSLNFPTPFPRKRDAMRRLVILERLLEYGEVLGTGGVLTLRTDSLPLFRFALTQFELAGYELLEICEDAPRHWHGEPETEYERKLRAQGASVFAIAATPGKPPHPPVQTAELSLVAYLPEDLEALGYVPHGMQGTVFNLRNRRKREQRRHRSSPS